MSVRLENQKLHEVVKSILYIDKETRNNNDRLYLAVITQLSAEKGINLHQMSVPTFFSSRVRCGFPTYESVTRVRRKCQEEDKTLLADDDVQAMRELREEEYRDWAVGKRG